MNKPWVKLIVSIAVSGLILWLLMRLVGDSANPIGFDDLSRVITGISMSTFLAFLSIHLIGMVLRTIRFQVLLKANGSDVTPSFGILALVTLVRGMTVDMLPARLGELFYVGLLNRGCGVRLEHGFSSLALSIWFDLMVIAPLILGLLMYPVLEAGIQQRLLVITVMLVVICVIGILLLHPGMSIFARWVNRYSDSDSRILRFFREFVQQFADSVQQSLNTATIVKTFFLTVGLRVCKYLSITMLFIGIAEASFPTLADASPVSVLVALLASEASASLPVPAFMGFGVYEAGGLAVFTMLGFDPADAGLTLFATHVTTQVIDYTLGGIALILFLMFTGLKPSMITTTPHKRSTIASGDL